MYSIHLSLLRLSYHSVTTFSLKVQVVPYTFVRRGVLVREDTYAEPSACVASSFPHRLYLPSVPTGYPFAAG